MKVVIVIPARWASTRFTGKALALINKVPMIERVYCKAIKSKEADKVIVATDNLKIFNFCKKKNINVVMTSRKCRSGMERVHELSKKTNYDIYVNLQGDEPLINPKNIDKVIRVLKKNIIHGYYISTGCAPENNLKQDKKNSLGFLVMSKLNDVLYASRSAIPFNYSNKKIKFYRTIGLFACKKEILKKFFKIKSKLAEHENLEFVKFLENDIKVKAVSIKEKIAGVNYPSDIKRAEKLLNE